MIRTTCRKLRIQTAMMVIALSIPMALTAATESKGPAEDPVAEREISPMQLEIQERVELERGELETLYEQFRNAASHKEAMQIQKQVQEMKINTRIDLFKIQAKYARERGDEARAVEIEAIIESLVIDGSHGEPVADRAESID